MFKTDFYFRVGYANILQINKLYIKKSRPNYLGK